MIFKRNPSASGWSDWELTQPNDTVFFQLFNSQLIAFDFSNLFAYYPPRLNTALNSVVAIKGNGRLLKSNPDGVPIAKYENGIVSLIGNSDATFNQMVADSALIKGGNSLFAFSFKYSSTKKQAHVIWQNQTGVNGRIQMLLNTRYNGSANVTVPNMFQIFIHGVTEGSGAGGMIAAKKVAPNIWYRCILSLASGSRASKLIINRELVDKFTIAAIANINTQVLGASNGFTDSVNIGRMLSVNGFVGDDVCLEVDTWLGKPFTKAIGSGRRPLEVLLTTSKASAAAIIPNNGIYDENMLLYSLNCTSSDLI